MFMDESLIKVEGRMVGQNLDMAKHFKLGMDMSIYAKSAHRAVLEPELKWAFDAAKALPTAPKKSAAFPGRGRMLSDPVGSGGSGSGLPQPGMDPKLQGILDGLKKVEEDEKQSDKVMVRFCCHEDRSVGSIRELLTCRTL
jgi:SWI/SNF-related matrix-associated actin-dependent regulator of chromatin subfamily A3